MHLALSANLAFTAIAPRQVQWQMGNLLAKVGVDELLYGSEAARVDDAVAWRNGRMRMRGGGLELVSIDDSPEGAVVHVRFAGMCTACAWKTLTWFGTLKDAIKAPPGVVRVEALGPRVSEQAEFRFRAVHAASPTV